MRRAALVVLLYGVLTPNAANAQTAVVERGMKVYGESKCMMCHSIAGKGNAKGVLDDVGSKLTADEIRQWLVEPQVIREKTNAERKPPMKSFATLPKGDLDALVGYLQTLKAKK